MAVASAGPYANNLHLTPDTNTSSLNFFTGQMLFLTTNQQCQSTEGNTQRKQHIKKSVFSFLRQLTTWQSQHLLLCATAAADRRPAGSAAIDRYLLAAGPTAANLRQWRAVARRDGWTHGQTNGRTGRTPDSCIDPAPHTMCSRSANN